MNHAELFYRLACTEDDDDLKKCFRYVHKLIGESFEQAEGGYMTQAGRDIPDDAIKLLKGAGFTVMLIEDLYVISWAKNPNITTTTTSVQIGNNAPVTFPPPKQVDASAAHPSVAYL